MEDSSYKDFKTSRGVTYHYFRHEGQGKNQTLLFCHGFPSTSYDWRCQVLFFKELGYDLIVPDMLGYGGTDRPKDPDLYAMSLQTKDFEEILDHEGVNACVVIGHDWGSLLASHLIIRYPDRYVGLVLLALGYLPPAEKFDVKEMNRISKEETGQSVLGYQEFFVEDGAEDIITQHFESFDSVFHAANPVLSKLVMCPVGALKDYLLKDKLVPLATYVINEERQKAKEILLKDKLHGGLQWYKAVKQTYEDSLDVSRSNFQINQPVLFVGALQDHVCRTEPNRLGTAKYAKNFKTVDLDTSHWIMLEKPDELNVELLIWLRAQGF